MEFSNVTRYMGFSGDSVVKNLPANAEDMGLNPWRRKWQPTPVFSPGKSMGSQRVRHNLATKQEEADICLSQRWP